MLIAIAIIILRGIAGGRGKNSSVPLCMKTCISIRTCAAVNWTMWNVVFMPVGVLI